MDATPDATEATSGYLNRRLRNLTEAQLQVTRARVALQAFDDKMGFVKVKKSADEDAG